MAEPLEPISQVMDSKGDYPLLESRTTGLYCVSDMRTPPIVQPRFTHQMTDAEFEELFPTDEACKAYLTDRLWSDGIVKCPRCGKDKVWTLKTCPFHWQCNQCGPRDYRFSVLVGTAFENRNVGLRQWFKVIHLMLTGKKGIAALQDGLRLV
jgi:predicted RNA-binding Zn-ribbon protein involved in translation (DUF1610 family)